MTPLRWDEKFYLPQETGNYSVAGFKLNMERKMTHYLITYYLPSGLFVVVSWASFLIPSDDIQVRKYFLIPHYKAKEFDLQAGALGAHMRLLPLRN